MRIHQMPQVGGAFLLLCGIGPGEEDLHQAGQSRELAAEHVEVPDLLRVFGACRGHVDVGPPASLFDEHRPQEVQIEDHGVERIPECVRDEPLRLRHGKEAARETERLFQ